MLKLTVFILFVIKANGQWKEESIKKTVIEQGPMSNKDGNRIPVISKLKPSANSLHQPGGGEKRPPVFGKPAAFKLAESKECADDIVKHCNPKIYKNNFAILDCLQNDVKVGPLSANDSVIVYF
jgi:hypothetical protein